MSYPLEVLVDSQERGVGLEEITLAFLAEGRAFLGWVSELKERFTVVIVTHESDIAAFTKQNITFRDGRIIKAFEVENPRDAREELANMPVTVEEEV